MFIMFGRTGAPTKRGPHRPEIVERYAMHYDKVYSQSNADIYSKKKHNSTKR